MESPALDQDDGLAQAGITNSTGLGRRAEQRETLARLSGASFLKVARKVCDMADRKQSGNWNLWQDIPQAEIWKWVALSCYRRFEFDHLAGYTDLRLTTATALQTLVNA